MAQNEGAAEGETQEEAGAQGDAQGNAAAGEEAQEEAGAQGDTQGKAAAGAEAQEEGEAAAEAEAQKEGAAEAEAALVASNPKGKGQKGFEKWLRSLPGPVLRAAFDQAQLTNSNNEECLAYVSHMREIQTIEVCTKCEYLSGCVACSYAHALRYCLRHGRPPSWWRKSTMSVLRGMCR